jgi:hypothetical protein
VNNKWTWAWAIGLGALGLGLWAWAQFLFLFETFPVFFLSSGWVDFSTYPFLLSFIQPVEPLSHFSFHLLSCFSPSCLLLPPRVASSFSFSSLVSLLFPVLLSSFFFSILLLLPQLLLFFSAKMRCRLEIAAVSLGHRPARVGAGAAWRRRWQQLLIAAGAATTQDRGSDTVD